jgi:SAM-dependent methyltransferase
MKRNSYADIITDTAKFYAQISLFYAEIYPDLANSEREFARKIIEHVPSGNEIKKVLDSACGVGYLVKALNDMGFDAYGTDLSTQQVACAKKSNQGVKEKFLATDWRDLADHFKKGTFDLVLCVGPSIHHIPQRFVRSSLASMVSVLRTDGILVLETLREYDTYLSPKELFKPRGCVVDANQHCHFSLFIDHDVKKYSFVRDVIHLKYEANSKRPITRSRLSLKHYKITKEILTHHLKTLSCRILSQFESGTYSWTILAQKSTNQKSYA